MSNILEVVVADRNFATMLKNVKAAGLEAELSKTGPYTVFAPTDLAFGKLPAADLDEMLKPENKLKLTDFLNYHVVEGKVSFKDLTDGMKLKTVNGKELIVNVKDGNTSVNGARVQARDIEADNGVIHSLDKVIKAKLN